MSRSCRASPITTGTLKSAVRRVARDHGRARPGRYLSTNEEFSLRWVLIHMIEEYARHDGHADLIREAIDGAVGE